MKENKSLTRCEKGHFYDGNKYDTCPHCQNTSAVISETQLGTEAFASGMFAKVPTEEKSAFTPKAPEPVQPAFTMDEPENPSKRLPEMFTMQNIPSYSNSDDNHTVHYYQKTIGTEPVVGWVVCIDGMHFGQDFRIKSGRNFIGRSGSMDICLSGDTAVSRENHAIITYDPKGNSFFVQPGNSASELCYLNDKPLLEATPFHSGDKLLVGETTLMFTAFCGEGFTWKK